MRNVFVGIDLGTTNCKVAIINRRVDPSNEEIENLNIPQFLSGKEWSARGVPYLPSVVYFDNPKEVYVGQYARRDMVVARPERTVRSIKRLMGRTWSYTPFAEVTLTPQMVAAIILRKLRQAVEANLHQPVESAVVTVPASFDSRQREATLDAAEIAGFDRSQITLLDEPTAAILDYVVKQIRRRVSYVTFEQPQTILVFDMGGGTLDVSIVQTEPVGDEMALRILARSRYTELAGNDFDLRLAGYLLNVFESANQTRLTELAEQRLRRTVASHLLNLGEDLKVTVSRRLREGTVYVEDLERLGNVKVEQAARAIEYGERLLGRVPDLTLGYRTHFERIWAEFLTHSSDDSEQVHSIYAPIDSALAEAFPEAANPRQCVDLVLLHGGMCELPVLRAQVQAYFPGVRVEETPDLMNSVARGAAIYDAMLSGSRSGNFANIQMRKQPVFEAVFIEEYGRELRELIPKTAVPGDTGEMAIVTPPERPSRLPISLYHGFRADDPFVTLDRELAIVFDYPPNAGETVHLCWRVLQDRTLEYWWRASAGDEKPLRTVASQGRDRAKVTEDISAQRQYVEDLTIH